MEDMNITKELVVFLDKYNGRYNENNYINTEFRVYYVLKNKMIANSFCINRENHTLAQANKIVKTLMEIMYDNTYTCEYTGQIYEKQVRPFDSTIKNEYLKYETGLYII